MVALTDWKKTVTVHRHEIGVAGEMGVLSRAG
jgi:hypothetical protein